MDIYYTCGKIKLMFQTTNQRWMTMSKICSSLSFPLCWTPSHRPVRNPSGLGSLDHLICHEVLRRDINLQKSCIHRILCMQSTCIHYFMNHHHHHHHHHLSSSFIIIIIIYHHHHHHHHHHHLSSSSSSSSSFIIIIYHLSSSSSSSSSFIIIFYHLSSSSSSSSLPSSPSSPGSSHLCTCCMRTHIRTCQGYQCHQYGWITLDH